MSRIEVTAYVDLSEIDIDDLIEEVESAGYIVIDEDEAQKEPEDQFTREEHQVMLDAFKSYAPGSIQHSIYNKLLYRK